MFTTAAAAIAGSLLTLGLVGLWRRYAGPGRSEYVSVFPEYSGILWRWVWRGGPPWAVSGRKLMRRIETPRACCVSCGKPYHATTYETRDEVSRPGWRVTTAWTAFLCRNPDGPCQPPIHFPEDSWGIERDARMLIADEVATGGTRLMGFRLQYLGG